MTHQFLSGDIWKIRFEVKSRMLRWRLRIRFLSLVQYGLGIAFIPEPMAEEAVMRQEVVSITVREHIPDREICMVYDEKRSMSVAAQRFKKLLMEEGKQETSANKKS